MHPILQSGSVINGEQVEATHKLLHELFDKAMRSRGDAQCQEYIGRIQRVLPRHMAFEEAQGGLFSWLEAILPKRRGEVQQLMAEHAQMHSMLGELDESTLPTFGKLFLRHEAAEYELLEAARAETRV